MVLKKSMATSQESSPSGMLQHVITLLAVLSLLQFLCCGSAWLLCTFQDKATVHRSWTKQLCLQEEEEQDEFQVLIGPSSFGYSCNTQIFGSNNKSFGLDWLYLWMKEHVMSYFLWNELNGEEYEIILSLHSFLKNNSLYIHNCD